MSNSPKRSPQRTETRSDALSRLERRNLLHAGATAALAAVAGCLTDESTSDGADDESDGGDGSNGSESSDEGDDGSDDDADDSESDADPEAVVDAYLEAAADEDTDAIDDLMHSLSPFNPADWEEDGWEFRGGEDADTDEYETTVVTEDGSVDDVFELEGAEFWFSDVDLEAEIGDEDIALVDLEAAAAESDAETDADTDANVDADGGAVEPSTWVLVTEDGEWRILFMGQKGEEDDTPDDPEAVFEEEIIDEDNDVVEEIDWEYDQDTQGEQGGDEDPFADVEWVQVVFTDDPGIEADRVRAESTIDGGESELYGDEPGSWADSWVNITHHPDGDQVVVTAVQDGEETVVHREHYLPDSDGVDTDD